MELRIFCILGLIFVTVTFKTRVTLAEDMPCVPKTMQTGGGFVCVCNSTYCDTINRPLRLPQGQYQQYTTTNSTPGFSHTVASFTTNPPVNEDDVVFTVNSSVLYQEILGFGGAFTDSAGMVLQTLPSAAQDNLIQSYFGPSGIEYTFGRVPIGSTDFSVRSYTLDDYLDDEHLQYFNLSMEDYDYKIPMIKRAMAVSKRPIKIMGCAWNAPDWMRTNTITKYYITEKYLQAFAEYHIKFVQMYQQNGVDVWAISGGNEVFAPMWIPIQVTLTIMTAPVQRRWFKDYLKPLMVANNLSDVKLLALDDMRPFVNYWMDRFADDSEALEAVDAVGMHWYLDFIFPVSQLDLFYSKYPDKLIIYTETSINGAYGSEYFDMGSWEAAVAYIYDAMQNIDHWTNAYIDWNLCLNLDYGPTIGDPVVSAVVVNETSGEFYKQPIFYAMGHLSKFFPPGSRRMMVGSNQNQTNSTDSTFPENITMENMKEYLKSGSKSGVKGNFPLPIVPNVPSTVTSTGTANPDGSYTVMVFSNENVTRHVRIVDERLGTISTDIKPMSINSFIYWAN